MLRPERRHDAHIRACHPWARGVTVHQLQRLYDGGERRGDDDPVPPRGRVVRVYKPPPKLRSKTKGGDYDL